MAARQSAAKAAKGKSNGDELPVTILSIGGAFSNDIDEVVQHCAVDVRLILLLGKDWFIGLGGERVYDVWKYNAADPREWATDAAIAAIKKFLRHLIEKGVQSGSDYEEEHDFLINADNPKRI